MDFFLLQIVNIIDPRESHKETPSPSFASGWYFDFPFLNEQIYMYFTMPAFVAFLCSLVILSDLTIQQWKSS